jgi:signal peptidase II
MPPMPKLLAYLHIRQHGLILALVMWWFDLASKYHILVAQAQGQLPVWLVPHQIGFHFAWNRGMSFSLFQHSAAAPLILGAIAIVACAWFVHWLGKPEVGQRWHQTGLGLIIGGALGNLADRLQHGAVVDFLLINPGGWFPYTFNVADACITVGVALLLLGTLGNNKGQ